MKTTDIKVGSYASTKHLAGCLEYTAICKILRIIPDSQPSRDSKDYLFEVQVGRRTFLRRRSELKPRVHC